MKTERLAAVSSVAHVQHDREKDSGPECEEDEEEGGKEEEEGELNKDCRTIRGERRRRETMRGLFLPETEAEESFIITNTSGREDEERKKREESYADRKTERERRGKVERLILAYSGEAPRDVRKTGKGRFYSTGEGSPILEEMP